MNPYLNFNGDCEAAFRFYAESLGGSIDAMMPHEGTPAEMGSDVPADRCPKPQGFAVSLQVDTAVEAENAFRALSEGATVSMPLQQTFFAARFGMLVDRFGIPWMINCAPASL